MRIIKKAIKYFNPHHPALLTVLMLLNTTSLLYAFTITNSFEVIKVSNVGYGWKSVSFNNTYSTAPVVVCTYRLPSSSSPPVVVRLNNITTSSFQVKIQQPVNSSSVTASDVTCLVAAEGGHTLPDGYQFEARKVLSTDTSGDNADGWNGTGENVSSLISGNYGSSPVVLGQVMSYNDPNFSVFWTYNCSNRATPPSSSNICVGKHIGQTSTATPLRQNETLGYIVIEGSGGATGTISGQNYRVALGSDTIDGVDNSGDSYTVGTGYNMGVATQSAMDGSDGGWAVFYGSNPFAGSGLDLAIDEDELGTASNEPERAHTSEQVAYWIFSDDPGLGWMEVRHISSVSGSWSTLNFNNTYTSPVAVCTYNLPSSSNNEAVIRLRNVNANSMEIRLQRPRDSTAVTANDVYCIIMEEGTHTFDGRSVEAHKVISNGTNRNSDWGNSQMEHVNYTNSYTSPVVLGQVMSYNDNRWSVFWSSNGNRTNPPDSSSLYVGKHIGEDSAVSKYRYDETLGFIVGSAAEGVINHIYYKLARGADTIYGVGNSPPYSYPFSSSSHTQYSYGVATQNAEDGGNGGWAVLYGSNPVSTKIDLAIEEEVVAGDTTRTHTDEQVSYWVFDPYPNLTLTKQSCVISDPVNGTTNPKRIPGATIRYALEVTNTNPRDAENVTVNDTLDTNFDTTSITQPRVGNGSCNCINPGSTSTSGSVSGNTVTVNFGTVSGGTATTPTKECGYFEADIQ